MEYKRLEQVALAVFLLPSNKKPFDETKKSVLLNSNETSLYYEQNK